MGLKSEVDALYNLNIEAGMLRQVSLPAAAPAALAVSGITPLWGAWADVVVSAGVLLPTLVVGFALDGLVVEIYTVELGNAVGYANAAGVTGGGAAVIAAAARSNVRFSYIQVTAAGVMIEPFFTLAVPVLYNVGEGIIARSGTVGGGDAANITVFAVTGF